MGSSVNRSKHLREKESFLHSADECYRVKASEIISRIVTFH